MSRGKCLHTPTKNHQEEGYEQSTSLPKTNATESNPANRPLHQSWWAKGWGWDSRPTPKVLDRSDVLVLAPGQFESTRAEQSEGREAEQRSHRDAVVDRAIPGRHRDRRSSEPTDRLGQERVARASRSNHVDDALLAFANLLGELPGGAVAAGELALPEASEEGPPRRLPCGFCARFWRGFDPSQG